MRQRSWNTGGVAFLVAGLAWAAWFFLETAPPRMGYDDTDSPAESLRFLSDHPGAWAQAGVAFFVLAVALVVAAFALAERLDARAPGVGSRASTTFGVLGAAFFVGHGAVRMSEGPVRYIESLDRTWGEAAYVATQMAGVHLMAAAALLCVGLWAGSVALVGWRSGVLPRWLAVTALFPALRLVAVLGPLGLAGAADGLWIAFMASIAMTPVWLLAMGVWMLREPARSAPAAPEEA